MRAHPSVRFAMLFPTEISCRQLFFFLTFLWYFFCPSRQNYGNLPMKHCINQSNQNIFPPSQNLSHPPCLCLPGKYFSHFTHARTKWNFTAYYFYRVLMIIHETELLPKDSSAITSLPSLHHPPHLIQFIEIKFSNFLFLFLIRILFFFFFLLVSAELCQDRLKT